MRDISKIMGAAVLLVMSSSAWADVIPQGTGLQNVLNGITCADPDSTGLNCTLGTSTSSVDVTTDMLLDTGDSYWSVDGSGGSISTMIIELAGFAANTTFGIYDQADSTNFVELFTGGDGAGSQVTLSILGDGSVLKNSVDTGADLASALFGYYIDTTVNQPSVGKWYSDTSLNSDDMDHMLAYQGTNEDRIQILPFAAGMWASNEYVLAWEDLAGPLSGPSDRDFTDMVVMVESVTPVPGPAPLLVFGIGLIGLGISRQRRTKDAA